MKILHKWALPAVFLVVQVFGVFVMAPQAVYAADCSNSSGVVPCGRNCDNPATEIDERDMCTLCHLLVGIDNIIDWGFAVLLVIAVMMIVIAGVTYIVSGGNQSITKAAKSALISTLVGTAIMLLAWLVVNTIIAYILTSDNDAGTKVKGWSEFTCITERNE